LNRFHLNDELLIDEEINPKSFRERGTIKENWKRLLALHDQAPLLDPLGQKRLIDGFEYAGAKLLVEVKAAIDRDRNHILNIPQSSSRLPSSSRLRVKPYTTQQSAVRLS